MIDFNKKNDPLSMEVVFDSRNNFRLRILRILRIYEFTNLWWKHKIRKFVN